MREVEDSPVKEGLIRLRSFSVAELEARLPWSELTEREKLALLEDPLVEPKHTAITENIVLNSFLNRHAAGNITLPLLALGDGTETPQYDNTELNNEVARTGVGQDEASGPDRLTSTLLSQNEGNGKAIREIGFHDGIQLLTHSIFEPNDRIDEKTSDDVVTIDYIIRYGRLD